MVCPGGLETPRALYREATAEELRRQFEDRDVISWGDDDDNGDLVFKPSIQPRLYTTQPVTPKGSESWIR